jgi:Amt family ammonium transporter
MQSGTERITDIVRSLKDFSHLGGSTLKHVDIHQGLENTLTILGSRLKQGARPEIQIVRRYGNVPKIECYSSQLNQVFMNLLSNAIDAIDEKWESPKYAPSEASGLVPQITVSTMTVPGDRLHLFVSDNGIGIPDDVKRRMLDPFFTTKPVGKGTGLGMSISYRIIVEQHRGRLRCVSTPGQGTQFLIDIPIWQTASER